jgi:catechol 2,3-dioxygenase-like lactoylglutathione lyase family enzyme
MQLRCATLTVENAEAAAARYRDFMNYRLVEAGEVSRDLAASWGAPDAAGRRMAVMQPESGAPVFLRMVEGRRRDDYRPLRTHGWAAIELCVRDVLSVHERMKKSPFEVIGPPRPLSGLPTIYPMQVKGPDDEIVYLTEIRGDLPEYDLPRAASLIDRLFICVLACSNMQKSAEWFQKEVGLAPGRVMEIEYAMLAASFGTPPERRYAISTMTHGRDVVLELDQYPEMATGRAYNEGELPPGVAIVSLLTSDFDRFQGCLGDPIRAGGSVYGGARSGVLRAPDGALVEIVEAAR